MKRQVMWQPADGPGVEHLAVEFGDGLRADGLVVGVAREPFRIRYDVRTDEADRIRSVRIESLVDDAELSLERAPDGTWTRDGEPFADLNGCSEVDISVTPFTNTLPIRHLRLAEGETATIRVAYVDATAMTVEPVEQRYTCVDPLDRDGGTFGYESLESEFRAELPVDAVGLVRDYPGVFERVYP